MKIKLPEFRFGRSAPGPAPAPGGTLTSEPVAQGSAGDRMRLLSRRLRGAAGYVALFVAVFFVFVWVSLPTRAIAWRIGQAARDAGYIIEIEDMSISPFGGITLYNVNWTFQPSHSGQIPSNLLLPEVDVDVSVLKLLFGSYDVEVDTSIDGDDRVHIAYTRSESESTVQIQVTDLLLTNVPKLQQSVNAPLYGQFALDVDMTMPDNQFSHAVGTISLECTTCKIGDNVTLLYIPGSSGMLAKGMTLPEIDLGTLVGKLVVTDGKATAETFETTSPDIVLKVTGGLNLSDPFSKSEFNLDMKLLLTPALQERSEALKLIYQTAPATSKLDPPEQDWLGFKLRGSAGKPKFTGIKAKTREERERDRRNAKLEADAKRKAAKAKREREKKNAAPDDPTGGFVPPPMDSNDPPPEAPAEDSKPVEPPPSDDNTKPIEMGRPEDTRQDPGNTPEARPEERPAPEARPEERPADDGQAGGQEGGQGDGQQGQQGDGQQGQQGDGQQSQQGQQGDGQQGPQGEGQAPQGEAGQEGAPPAEGEAR